MIRRRSHIRSRSTRIRDFTPPSPEGPLVPPGVYTVRLTAAGKSYTQPVTVVNDPRSPADRCRRACTVRLADQDRGRHATEPGTAYEQVAAMRALVAADTALAVRRRSIRRWRAVGANLERGGGGGGGFGGFRRAGTAPTFVRVNGNLVTRSTMLENGDLAPKPPAMQRATSLRVRSLKTAVTTWTGITWRAARAFNAELTRNNAQADR